MNYDAIEKKHVRKSFFGAGYYFWSAGRAKKIFLSKLMRFKCNFSFNFFKRLKRFKIKPCQHYEPYIAKSPKRDGISAIIMLKNGNYILDFE